MDAEREVFFDVFRLRRETRSFIPFRGFRFCAVSSSTRHLRSLSYFFCKYAIAFS